MVKHKAALCVSVMGRLFYFLIAVVPGSSVGAKDIDFNRDIRPILSNKCFACHGPDSASREANLRLDREESAKADHDGVAAIIPGKIDQSELVRRVTAESDDERMPPADSGKKLQPEEIEILKRWIANGAKWSLAWSFIPPTPHDIPVVRDASWPLNPVDRFVWGRLDEAGMKPSVEADKTTLIRRLYFDFVGLPPQPEDVDDFLTDQSADAYERIVDKLLASPHFGERMAMYWLDLVRYADTVGYHGDQEHNISPYRDYVINALNENMPFDRFTREQLAGDLMPTPTTEQRIATGYNRVLQTSHEGGVQPREYLAIYAADHVRNVSAVWMGATLGCAQCHDHKYDPYTSRDFYSMAAFFADIDEARHLTEGVDASPTVRAPEMELLTKAEESTIKALAATLDVLKQRVDVAKPKGDKRAQEPLTKQLAVYETRIARIHQQARRTMITQAIPPRDTRILPRGSWMDESGEVVLPAIPQFLGKLDTGARRATRLDLANWLLDTRSGAGGLTARVMVNRFWYLLFGRGIAGKLDDFGGQGEPPENPELLDYLALEFVDSGWSIKHMFKLIAMSRAYRQSSLETPEMYERDPLNRQFGRQGRSRIAAESVRDSALSISGLLNPTVGGPSVHPYQPAGYYRHLNFPQREYVADNGDQQWRRGVYMHWQRQYLHPMLKAFDAPTREECTAERTRSNTSPAALVLLNDPTFVECARAFAEKILQEGGATTESRIDFAFRRTVSRNADADEKRLLQNLLVQSQAYYHDHADAADKLLAIGNSRASAELDKIDLASWSLVARVILNLNEAVTRN